MEFRAVKPLGHKAYGSIPHLPGSRLGPGDHHCEEGQARIATVKTRDRHDIVICQEKLDGSNVSIARIGGQLHFLTRAGYPALSSNYEQHHKFAEWAQKNRERFWSLLQDGERICGEWLLQAHGTRYNLPHEAFVAFDLFTGRDRIPYTSFEKNVLEHRFTIPLLLSYGPAYSIENALNDIAVSGHGAIDPVEGAIWRVERMGKVDFLTKFVHHHKQDGLYLPEKNGTGAPIWNTYKTKSPL